MIIELTIVLGVAVGCGLGALALHPLDKAEDLPALGDSIDRAIALAAALPGDDVFTTKRTVPSHVADLWAGYGELAYASPEERVYLTPQGAELAAAL